MCGINGLIVSDINSEMKINKMLIKMNQQITHRGPDEEGFYTDTNTKYQLGMAMTRLSIIDLKTGSQPIFNQSKSVIIVLNGEIYNYKELKSSLIKLGIKFQTESDTEVILKLYEEYGTASFKMLDGMFAFSIYDKSLQKTFIVRDFFGEKPLYYTKQNNTFYWASELKSIICLLDKKPAISKKGLNLFFKLTYIPAPFSIYENIKKLESNSFITFNNVDFTFEINKISVEKKIETADISLNDAISDVKDLVNKSVENRLIADVEVGSFLSGGVDSSIISLLLSQQKDKRINTFSIGFKKKSFNETDKSRVVAKLINSKHHEFIIDESDLKNYLPEILINFDEPFADSSALASYIVANKASDYLKVALTGDGGDEVFGGYNKYYIGNINKKYTKHIPHFLHKTISSSFKSIFKVQKDTRGFKFKINKLLNAIDYNNDFYWNIISLGFQASDLNKVLLPIYQENNILSIYKTKLNLDKIETLTDFRLIDKIISLEGDMLVKVDRTSMLNSLETRAPFLNKNIWDYTLSLPENYLMNGTNKKYILKKSFEEYFPTNFLEKSKMGFGVPVGDWLRKSLRKELESYIELSFLEKQHIFNSKEIIKLVNDHLENRRDYSFQIWTFFVFQKWYINTFN